LLHKRHAGVLLSFFQKVFRDSNILEIPEERLEGRWESFIEEDVMLSDWEGETPTNTAKFYLEEWCKNRWLARTYDEQEATYLYRLTAHTEQALLFVEQHLTANRRSYIGTESNFSKIWHSLSELAEKTQSDPKVREKQLLAERDQIDAEIMELRQTGKPRRLDDTAVKARLYDLVAMANRFLADFRSVEDSFRKQRDEIQNLYLGQEQSRGDILAGALDAVELLKDSDEGRSFFGFQRLLRSSDEVDNLDLSDALLLGSPQLVLSGHVHRPKRWWDRTGSTISLNPGANEGAKVPNCISLDLGMRKACWFKNGFLSEVTDLNPGGITKPPHR
jgi:hypothetical protein